MNPNMTSLKKKICVTVFLDELFEVVDEPAKKFHVQKSTPMVGSRRRGASSKPSFSRKFSDPFDGKLKSWSENHFLHREKMERKLKKYRGCKPKLPISAINELDQLESKANEKSEIETVSNHSNLGKNPTVGSFDDEWHKECSDAKRIDEVESEYYESDLEIEGSAKSTQISPVFGVKKISQVTKLVESREIIQKLESMERLELIKIDQVPGDDLVRHSLCSDLIKKSFEELFRRKDSNFERNLTSVSEMLVGDEKTLDRSFQVSETLTFPTLQEGNDLQFLSGNQENILCYAVQVGMAAFEQIVKAGIGTPKCLLEEMKIIQTDDEGAEEQNQGVLEEVRNEEVQTDDEVFEAKSYVILSRKSSDDGNVLGSKADYNAEELPVFKKINKTGMGVITLMEFKHIASFAYQGFSPLPISYENKELLENSPKSQLEDNESSIVICMLSLEDLRDKVDIGIKSLIPDSDASR